MKKHSCLIVVVFSVFVLQGCAERYRRHTPYKMNASVDYVFSPQTVIVHGENKTYYMVEPTAPPQEAGYSVLIFLHGLDWQEGHLSSVTHKQFQDISSLAHEYGFIAVFPVGEIGAFSDYPQARGWGPQKYIASVALIEVILEHLQQHYTVDSSRIVLSGFSNGAYFAAEHFLKTAGSPFSGYWLVGGGAACYPMSPRLHCSRMWVEMGEKDQWNTPPAKQLCAYLLESDCAKQLRFHEHSRGHELYVDNFADVYQFLFRS